MSICQHNDCDRRAVAEWNGCGFCDEHVRERLRTTADRKSLARIRDAESIIGDISGDIHIFRPEMRERILKFLGRSQSDAGDEHG